MTVAGVGEDVMIQRASPEAVRGRVYAAHIMVVNLSLSVPLLAAGVLVDATGPRAVMAAGAGLSAGAAIVLAMLWRGVSPRSVARSPARP